MPVSFKHFVILLAGVACASRPGGSALAQQVVPPQENQPQRRARAFRIASPPLLDGRVNEPAWEKITPAGDFIQQEPFQGSPATEKTEIRFAYDDHNLYIGIICFDSQPDDIVVTQNRRDGNLTDTDSIQILLDTFHDRYNAFIFGTSPTGIEYDAQVSKAGQGDTSTGLTTSGGGAAVVGAQRGGAAAVNLNWDGVWTVRSQITERGWEAEMQISLRTLRYNPGKDKVWGLQMVRNIRRHNEQSFWTPISRAFDLYQVYVAGELEGLDLPPQRDLQVIPYALGGLDQDYTRTNDQTKMARNAGLDVKYKFTPSLVMDATFNTDFAQVEVDEQQINLTRFNLFFPEKRPFFLENSGIFDFGAPRETELFFSRRIGMVEAPDGTGVQTPIDAGVRLSGKAGNYEIGLLNMKTRQVGDSTPANNFSVARVRRELPHRSSVGLMATNRESLSQLPGDLARPYNRAIGADANVGFGQYANLQNFYAKTLSPGLAGSTHAAMSSFRYDNSRHQILMSYREVGHNFNPEVGYLQRAGYRRPHFGYRRTFYPSSRRIRTIHPHFQWNRWYTMRTMDLESAYWHNDYGMTWKGGETMSLQFNRSFERLDKPFEVFPGIAVAPGRYSFNQINASYSTNQSAPRFAGADLVVGSFYSGTIRAATLSAGVRKGKNLTWTGNYTRNMIDLPEGNFTTDLISFRFSWSFTPKSYLQTFTQYNTRINQVGTNIRFALLSTASNGLYVVYNTRAATVDYRDPHDQPRSTLSRAFYVKYTYLFDF